MSEIIPQIDVPDDRAPALTDREYELFDRSNRIASWLARNTVAETVNQTVEVYGCDAATARKWVAKARDLLNMGVLEDLEQARRVYLSRLNRIHDLAMAHAVRDEVEITTKPQRITVDLIDGDTEERMINATITKVRPRALNTQALNTALKSAREVAMLTGARQGRNGSVSQTNIFMGQGVAMAHETERMSVEQLAGMLGDGVEVIDVEAGPGRSQRIDE